MPDGSSLEARTPPYQGMPQGGRADLLLERARAAFVEKGFDGASMQDLARAAGMSAGNFYRYFPSKDAIVEALIERDLADIEGAFQAIAASADPLGALKATMRERMAEKCDGDNTLWTEISATALRRPEVARVLRRIEDGITRRVAQVIGLGGGVGPDEAERRFGAHARVVFLIMHGAMTSNLDGKRRDDAVHDIMIRTIERVIGDALAESAPEAPLPTPAKEA